MYTAELSSDRVPNVYPLVEGAMNHPFQTYEKYSPSLNDSLIEFIRMEVRFIVAVSNHDGSLLDGQCPLYFVSHKSLRVEVRHENKHRNNGFVFGMVDKQGILNGFARVESVNEVRRQLFRTTKKRRKIFDRRARCTSLNVAVLVTSGKSDTKFTEFKTELTVLRKFRKPSGLYLEVCIGQILTDRTRPNRSDFNA